MTTYNTRNFIYVCQDDCCAHRGSCNEQNANRFQECPVCGEETDLMEDRDYNDMITGGLDWDV
jgi:transcription initiation factor IIE alpha subunit